MKFNKSIILIFAILPCVITIAQNQKKISVKIEFGGNEVSGKLNNAWDIRQDVGSYYSGLNNSANADLFASNIAAKLEYALFDNKFAVSAGLQFSNLKSNLYLFDPYNSDNAFFYLRYTNSGVNTNYAKIKSVTESANYLSLPLDIKFVPISFKNYDIYLRTGIDFGFSVGSKLTLDFANTEMKSNEQSIINNLGISRNAFISSWNTAIGISLGKHSRIKYNFELLLPSMYITKGNSSILNDEIFTGFKISAQLPIK